MQEFAYPLVTRVTRARVDNQSIFRLYSPKIHIKSILPILSRVNNSNYNESMRRRHMCNGNCLLRSQLQSMRYWIGKYLGPR